MRDKRKRINPGKPLPSQPRPSDVIRLLSSVIVSEEIPEGFDCPCWLWCGGQDGEGYGFIKVRGEKRWAHRVSHEVFKGPVEAGLEVNHGCHRRNCINPKHINAEPASVNRSNTSRARMRGAA